MKKYIKPTVDVEMFELMNIIASLSENKSSILDTSEDSQNWDEFWQ